MNPSDDQRPMHPVLAAFIVIGALLGLALTAGFATNLLSEVFESGWRLWETISS